MEITEELLISKGFTKENIEVICRLKETKDWILAEKNTSFDIENDEECDDFRDCDYCEDEGNYSCEVECKRFDEDDREYCRGCKNLEHESACIDCCITCHSGELDEKCILEPYCEDGIVSYTYDFSKIEITNPIITNQDDDILYQCPGCNGLIEAKTYCSNTMKSFEMAKTSPVTLMCSQCLDQKRLCKVSHEIKNDGGKTEITCWTEKELEELKNDNN